MARRLADGLLEGEGGQERGAPEARHGPLPDHGPALHDHDGHRAQGDPAARLQREVRHGMEGHDQRLADQARPLGSFRRENRGTMARFQRDEQRTYPIWWLIAGGLFIFSTVWACYAEFVTRVPWQKEQEAFFQMEYELATQNLKRAKNEFASTAEADTKKLKARQDELKREQATGKYAASKAKLTQLTRDFADAEQGKTFGK